MLSRQILCSLERFLERSILIFIGFIEEGGSAQKFSHLVNFEIFKDLLRTKLTPQKSVNSAK